MLQPRAERRGDVFFRVFFVVFDTGDPFVSQSDPIIIGSDHAGYALKQHIKTLLDKRGIPYIDIGVDSERSADYPLYAGRVARAVAAGDNPWGIAVCGTGIGASMAVNRFRGARGALCLTPDMARLAREHNNANVLVLGGRISTQESAGKILDVWLESHFQGGRHQRRIEQLDAIERTVEQ
jgi:ribose 5-phosphate isomerase B